MNQKLTENEFQLFRRLIEDVCSISLGADKAYLVESRLKGLFERTKSTSYLELYQKLRFGNTKELIPLLINAITTGETQWLRDRYPFDVLLKEAFPFCRKKLLSGEQPKIRIWSAGCSTGQEPYSIGMMIREYYKLIGEDDAWQGEVEIFASDISTDALETAGNGKYDTLSLNRGLPDKYRYRYFTPLDEDWQIDPLFLKMIKFKYLDLRDPFQGMGIFDIIFFRNVAIYFSDDFKDKLYEKLARQMRPGGWLFLGTGECPQRYCSRFTPIPEQRVYSV